MRENLEKKRTEMRRTKIGYNVVNIQILSKLEGEIPEDFKADTTLKMGNSLEKLLITKIIQLSLLYCSFIWSKKWNYYKR